MIASGQLRVLIDDDGLKGVTSNPAIFEKSITGSTDYDTAIEQLAAQNKTAMDIYESLAMEDIQSAADVLRSVYEATNGQDRTNSTNRFENGDVATWHGIKRSAQADDH